MKITINEKNMKREIGRKVARLDDEGERERYGTSWGGRDKERDRKKE